MENAIRIPRRFYDDHCERDLPAPRVCKTTKRHYWIDSTSKNLDELKADAWHYSDPRDFACEFGDYVWSICLSAKATYAAICAAENAA